jgi:hypothetical protein
MYYAGIGSRETPQEILSKMEEIAVLLANKHYTLRSGGADGADSAFEKGCDSVNGNKEIYIPWKNFNKNKSELYLQSPEAFLIAQQFHPAWHTLSDGVRRIMARNTLQVLGQDLKKETYSEFVVCYTWNGLESGGTGQAMRIAKAYGIQIYNLKLEKDVELLYNKIK